MEMISKEVKGSVCGVFSRVVGYYSDVRNWNSSKQQEFKDRELILLDK